MRIRAAFIRSAVSIFFTAGLFLAVFGGSMTVSTPAEAEWTCTLSDGLGECTGSTAPTLVAACEAMALNWGAGGILGRIDKLADPDWYRCSWEPAAITKFADTHLICPAGYIKNPARASGCQPPEPPEGFGVCPNCDNGGDSPGGGAPGSGSPGSDGRGSSGNPITLDNGNKFQAMTDYRSSGADTLEFTRYYNSKNWVGPNLLGWGWRHNFRAALDIYSSTGIWVHRPDGRIENFTSADGNNPWTAVKGGVVGKFEKTTTGWTYTRPDDTVEAFDAGGTLLSITRKNGYTQTLDYAVGGVAGVWGITDSHGRVLTLNHSWYGGGAGWRLTRMTDPDGRVYRYGYQGVNSYSAEPLVLNKVVYPDDIPDPPGGDGVKLLSHLDGPDGATTATDGSGSAHPLTFVGATQIDTAQSRFGGASALFDGTGTSYISIPDSPDWHFGAGQFTAEGWMRFSSTADYAALFRQWKGTDQESWSLDWTATNGIRFMHSLDGTDATVVGLAAAWTPTLNAWHHIAVDRDSGNNLRVYVDGTVLINTVVTGAFHDSTTNLDIGMLHNGWIDDVRIIKGVARYGGAFTPPSQPLGADLGLNDPPVTYLYEDARFPYGLTGIIDENGDRVATWGYDAEGRGLSSEHAGGVDRVTLAYNADGTRTVTNPLDKQHKYSFATIAGLPRIHRTERLAADLSIEAARDFTYQANGYTGQFD